MHNLAEIFANPAVLTAVVGAIVSLIVQGVKKLMDLKTNTWIVRGVVAVLAVVSTAVLQATGHSLIDPGLWTGIVQAALLYGVAHVTHSSVLKDPNKPPALGV